MTARLLRSWFLSGSVLVAGCAGSQKHFAQQPVECPILAEASAQQSVAEQVRQYTREKHRLNPVSEENLAQAVTQPTSKFVEKKPPAPVRTKSGVAKPEILQVGHSPQALSLPDEKPTNATLTIDGKQYRVQLVKKDSIQDLPAVHPAEGIADDLTLVPPPEDVETPEEDVAEGFPLDLGSALSMVCGQHPAVGFAQWKVQEAYAKLDQAEVLWLPSIQAGFSFHRHDGNYQASNGTIVDVNRSSWQYGFGAGATGAGTVPRPGLVAQFHLADAIFQPDIAEKTAWAHGHAANAVQNQQMLDVALAYLDLLQAEQDLTILKASRQRTSDLAKLTGDFAQTGRGLQADADRVNTELSLVENRLSESRERSEVASSRLAQTLSVDGGQRIVPLDPTVVPIDLVSADYDKWTLISTGLSQRPELKEAQALVAAACDEYQRQKYSPFVPSVLLGLSTNGFGGGVGTTIDNVDGRYDFDALMTWEVRNLGFGEKAQRREKSARVQQAQYEKLRLLDQVAYEISEAHSRTIHRQDRVEITQAAIQSAQDSFDRNLSRIRDGQGLPLEVLQSVRALEDSQRAYLTAVIDYNKAQFQLQWSLGWALHAGEQAE